MAEPTAETKQGLSGGAKLLIGCLGCLGVLVVAATIATAMGGFALKRQVDRFMGGVEDQQEASETLRRVAEEHPFEVPEDGVVTEDGLDRFLAVTDEAWEDMEPWAEDITDLRRLQERAGEGGVGDAREVLGGLQSVSGFARARVQIAEALDEVGMSLGEYVWTGITMSKAAEAVDTGQETEAVPEANRALAERRRDELPDFEMEEGEVGPGLVVTVATVWGMSEGTTWQALGLDTLTAR